MNIEQGLNQLSQHFMTANACMEREDYRAAINEYNKIIELVQILRKPFDNGEVPLNIVTAVFPKILESEKAARAGLSVAQLGIEAQKQSARQTSVNIPPPEETHIDRYNEVSEKISEAKQYTQHILLADYHMEREDYNSVIDEYNKALDKIHTLKSWVIENADKTSTEQFVEMMRKINTSEHDIHTGLFVAYFKIGNRDKAAQEQQIIDSLPNFSPAPPQNQSQSYQNQSPQNQPNAQAGGCFSTICLMCLILAAILVAF